MEIAVVGGGIMGLSAAYALHQAGHNVTLYEQYEIGHNKASSHDDHRLIRYPYGGMAGYMQMIGPAYAAWDQLWQSLGTSYYHETGTLVLGNKPNDWAADSRKTLLAHNHPVEDLSQIQLHNQYAYLDSAGIHTAFFQPSGGVLLATRILLALKAFLLSRQVTIHEQTRVDHFETDKGIVHASGSMQTFDQCIVTAGPWVSRLVPALADSVTPSRQVTLFFNPPEDDATFWNACPMILDIDHDTGFYLVPPRAGTPLKIGDHRFSKQGHPDHDLLVQPEEIKKMHTAASHRIPLLAQYPVHRSAVCYYTVADEERFIAHREGKTWILSGFSGHGFKFGPLIGQRLVQVIAQEIDQTQFSQWMAGHS